VSVDPSLGVPEIVGAVVLAGASGSTTPVAAVAAAVLPAALVAVTTARIVLPTSAPVSE
jgi:hypothetical protein